MEKGPTPKSTNLFQVYLRLRPPHSGASTTGERFLAVEEPDDGSSTPKHITLNPPNDRRRAVEKFAFTQVFEEDATQLDVFHCTGVADLIKGVLAPCGGDGTDALLATLGVTGSGKTHTILGSRSQRGLTQLSLDVIFQSLGDNLVDCDSNPALEQSIQASDPSEAVLFTAPNFIDSVYSDPSASFRASSRATTPMLVGQPPSSPTSTDLPRPPHSPSGPSRRSYSLSVRMVSREDSVAPPTPPSLRMRRGAQLGLSRQGPRQIKHFMAPTTSMRLKRETKRVLCPQSESVGPGQAPPRRLFRPSTFPQQPDVSNLSVSCDPSAEYAVVISMYEVYNDRIFDLLTPPVKSATTKEYRRRPLLFKSTEASPDRKVVAGLRKVICSNLQQALLVLEAGLHERRVTGTNSNSASSRSHGFFCVEVRKRPKATRRRGAESPWSGAALTIVDLAGSERARDAKTAGATLAEAGKINESLMYLGQCLQMQSDAASKDKPHLVPFRQCKLTELLFSNCYPSASAYASGRHRNPQKAVMIVTADPHGDFNATSQILRYSALAREVTVPRVPSISQTILNQAMQGSKRPSSPSVSQTGVRPFSPLNDGSVPYPELVTSPGLARNASPMSNTSGDTHRSTMEAAALEIARLSEEVEYLRRALDAERAAREEAEAHLLSMEDRMLELEQEIREDCTAEFEKRLEIEMARWRATLQVEMERGEEHWGRKIEVFERSMGIVHTDVDDVDDEDKENVLVEDANQELERLRRENEVLRREVADLSPTKRLPLRERGSDASAALSSKSGRHGADRVNSRSASRSTRAGGPPTGPFDEENSLLLKMENLRVSDNQGSGRGSAASGGSSPRKVRRLPGKRWNAAGDGDDVF